MKRMILTMAVALTGLFAMAQDNADKQDKRPDKTEMVKRRTAETVKRYGLNDSQAKQLLALNTKYADKMGGPGRGPRGGRRGGPMPPKDADGKAQQPPKDGQQAPKDGKRPELTAEQKAQMEAERKERQATMEAYDAELQKIMTADQFKQYKADMQKRGPRGPRGGQPRGQQ